MSILTYLCIVNQDNKVMEKKYFVNRYPVKFEKSVGTIPLDIDCLSNCFFKIESSSTTPLDIEFTFWAGNEAKKLPQIKGIKNHISYPFVVPENCDGLTFNSVELKNYTVDNLHISIYTEIDNKGSFID